MRCEVHKIAMLRVLGLTFRQRCWIVETQLRRSRRFNGELRRCPWCQGIGEHETNKVIQEIRIVFGRRRKVRCLNPYCSQVGNSGAYPAHRGNEWTMRRDRHTGKPVVVLLETLL